MRSFQRQVAVMALALSLAACDSSTDTNVVTPSAPAPGFTGNWTGQPAGRADDAVFLTLSQSGNRISGEGAIFRGDNPVPVQVIGTTSSRGTILDLLAAGSNANNARLSLRPNGAGKFSDAGIPQGLDFQLQRSTPAGGAPNAPHTFQIQGNAGNQAYTMQVDVTETGGSLEGQWQSGDIRLGENSAGGRATGALNCWRGWSYLNFQDQPTVSLPAGTLWFRFPSPAAIDPDSFLFVFNQGTVSTGGTITEVTP